MCISVTAAIRMPRLKRKTVRHTPSSDVIDDILEHLTSTLSASLVPIYRQPPGERIDHEGSGVLVRWRGDFFVLTAAHVIDALEGAIPIVGLQDRLGVVSSPNVRSNLPASGDRADDDLDIAAFPVRFETPPLNGTFVDSEDLDLDFDVAAEEDLFVVLGFPSIKQDMRIQAGGLQPYVYPLLATANEPRVHARFGTPVRLPLKFEPRDIWVDGIKRTAPKLSGISGCPVWRLQVESPDAKPPRLCAIVTDYDHAQREILATWVRLHLDAIDATKF